jgi:flagellar hook-associated protein 2
MTPSKNLDKYNEVIAKLNTETKEAKYRDYTPLLDEQKEAMSDKQIELWEEKAKSGLLRSDSILTSALTEMRRSLSSPVTGVTDTKFDTLSEIGITTGSYLEDGKLYINETKLKEAITQNGSKVMELFTKSSDSTVSTTKFNESGLGQRLYDQIVSSMGKITDKAGSVASLTDNSILGKSIDRMDDEIDRWQDRLSQIEDRYWRQFTAMEQAMNKANSQSSWLAQQFSS